MDGGSDGGSCVNTIVEWPLDTRFHIPDTETPAYTSNPPVQGPHYSSWARWRSYTDPVPRGHWVHNLEHGGVVFLYHPDAGTELVQALTRAYNAVPIGVANHGCELHSRAVLTPDPLLDGLWAVTVSGPEDGGMVGYYIKADCIKSESDLTNFAVQHRGRAAEDLCDEGLWP